uniref:Ion_trans domain-containing protein n=1 Tax=Bursaphelenchus xylophilus TaxID=6326 RepID=A0A1I7SHN7_BURXY
FVSHVNVQSVTSLQWMGKWTDFGFNRRRDFMRIVRHGVLYPIIGPIHVLSGGKYFTSFKNPVARFISQTAAYLILLTCIFLSRVFDQPDVERVGWLTPHTFFFAYIYSYFVGFILDQAASMWIMGAEFFFDMWWKWIDYAMCHVMLTVFILHICLLGESQVYNPNESMNDPGHLQVYYDIVFSFACLLATARGLYNLQLLRNLGSTIISTGRCMGEVVEYFFIMGLVMVAFSIALNLIAQPYHVEKFSLLTHAFRNLFWAFYGYLSPSDYHFTAYDFSADNFNKSMAQAGIEMLSVLYYMVMVISLLNLMISLLVERAHVIMVSYNRFKKNLKKH